MATEMKRATLLTVAKMLNATKDSKGNNVATKVPIVAIGTEELTEQFLAACESVLPENEELLPDQVCDAYNVLVSNRTLLIETKNVHYQETIEEQAKQTQAAEQADATLPVEKKEKKKEKKEESKVPKKFGGKGGKVQLIRELLLEKRTSDALAVEINKQFGDDLEKAKKYVIHCLKWLPTHGFPVKEEKGYYSASEKS